MNAGCPLDPTVPTRPLPNGGAGERAFDIKVDDAVRQIRSLLPSS